VKVVCSSDWHADWSTAGFSREGDVATAVDETVAAAVEQGASHYFFLGDLCDPDGARAHRAVELAVRTAVRLSRAGIASRWLAGNHDVVEDGHGTTMLGALRELESAELPVRVYDRPTVEVLPEVAVVALPYCARSHAYDPEAFVRANPLPGWRVVVLGHLNIAGIAPGSETDEMPRGRDVMFPLAACQDVYGERALLMNGHYHQHQVFRRIHVPGSLERLTFGEMANEPGYMIVEVL